MAVVVPTTVNNDRFVFYHVRHSYPNHVDQTLGRVRVLSFTILVTLITSIRSQGHLTMK